MINYIPSLNSSMPAGDAKQLNPLVLAFVGDSVQQLYVRTRLAAGSTKKAGELHKLAVREVKAVAQADILLKLLPALTEEEMDIYKRARNSKPSTIAKHASVIEYKMASGFEAVLGFLYLTGRSERLAQMLDSSAEIIASENN